ncbi:hypothetical protein GGR55DRAFT_685779 [Xylaria sp. FL0064]|nr:hypothetical protein GGR55DRAFT_685779 [Xylaria sp. FL0064]
MSDPAFKSFRSLNTKLKIYSHYSQELKRLRTRFEVQQDFFQSECELLLRNVTDNQSQIEAFLRARQLDSDCDDILKRLCTYLGTRQRAFQSTFEDIKVSIEDLEAELAIFEQFEYKREDISPEITINKTNYDEALERLKQSNYDLKGIRKHAKELRRDLACVQDAASEIKVLPSECSRFGKVRLAAHAFYEAMATHWVCEERKHQRDLISLFTNADVQHDVRMKFFLFGEWKFPEASDPERLDLVSLEVRSVNIEYFKPIEPEQSDTQRQSRNESIDPRVAVKPRRVRWAEEKAPSTSYTHPLSESDRHNLIPSDGINVKFRVKDSHPADVPGCALATQQLRGPSCLGYLDVIMRDPFRHSFYPWSGVCNGKMTASNLFNSAQPLANLLNQPVHTSFDIVDQLLMVKTMVATMLKFHSTPWLRSSTLHLETVIENQQKGAYEQPEPLYPPQGVADDSRLSQRIRNTSIHNLGVILLQIDHWMHLDPNAIDEVDRLATQRSRLGPKYRDMVQKCLHCDFGVGTDLLKHQLQSAILDKVLHELESMVSGLRMDDDNEEGLGT